MWIRLWTSIMTLFTGSRISIHQRWDEESAAVVLGLLTAMNVRLHLPHRQIETEMSIPTKT